MNKETLRKLGTATIVYTDGHGKEIHLIMKYDKDHKDKVLTKLARLCLRYEDAVITKWVDGVI